MNKIQILFLFAFPLVIISCNNEVKETKKNNRSFPSYKLVGEEGEVLVESFDSTIVDENKYNYNNQVFRVGTEFVYRYEHVANDNEVQYFKRTSGKQKWDFVNENDADSSVVRTVKITVENGNPMSKYIPDYDQTVIKYNYDNEILSSASGVVENEANVWMHPPRDLYFRILELNPFPYIKRPYEIGNKWHWSLRIGDHWGDERWKLWDGNIKNKYKYEIADKVTLQTEFGDLECYMINSTAESRIGATQLTAYYHQKYGFVKLNYTNIDGSKTNLKLVEHNIKWDKPLVYTKKR